MSVPCVTTTPSDIGRAERRLDPLAKIEHLSWRQVAAGQIGEFFKRQIHATTRQQRHKVVAFKHRHRAADHRAALHGDRPAGGDNHDFFQRCTPLALTR